MDELDKEPYCSFRRKAERDQYVLLFFVTLPFLWPVYGAIVFFVMAATGGIK